MQFYRFKSYKKNVIGQSFILYRTKLIAVLHVGENGIREKVPGQAPKSKATQRKPVSKKEIIKNKNKIEFPVENTDSTEKRRKNVEESPKGSETAFQFI